jgi:hypothetical protein
MGLALPFPAAEAATFLDPFTDGNLTAGADNSGLAWYRRSSNQTLGITNDSAGIGTGNALVLGVVATQVDRPVLGLFSDFTLVNVGDQISLTLDFRLAASPTVNTADGFRFGFYNSNGTLANADGSANSDNDFGYQMSFGTGTTAGFNLFEETNSNGAGGTGSGPDRVSLSPTVNATTSINDTLKHSLVYTVTKTASGVSFSASVDGTTLGTGVDNTSAFVTFNEVLVDHATPQNYLLDNVTVTTTTVPEPGTFALLGAGLMGLFGWRRSRSGRLPRL